MCPKLSSVVEVPSKFYKYRPMTPDARVWVERIVAQSEIYFPPAKSFNDPFDLRPVFSLAASKAEQNKEQQRLSKKFEPWRNRADRRARAKADIKAFYGPKNRQASEELLQEMHAKYVTEKVGVFCVTAKPNDILMWSHYANNHTGVCLEFDATCDRMAHAQKVIYSEQRVPINKYSDTDEEAMTKSLLTKSSQWSYEEEWRVIRYLEGPGPEQFSPNMLTGIIIGAAATPETVSIVQEWVDARADPVPIYKAALSKTQFSIEIEGLNVG